MLIGACFQSFITDFEHLLLVDIACDSEYHIVKVVECVVAFIHYLGSYLCDRLDRSRNVDTYRVLYIERFEQVLKTLSRRRVVAHFYLLCDDALLLLDIFLCEIG